MKKGEFSLKKLAGLIIILVIAIGVIMLVRKISIYSNALADDGKCKSSILAHTTLLKTTGESIEMNITCPTQYKTSQAANSQEVNKDLADSLRLCWAMWGEGTIALFKEDNNYCHICKVTSFENKKIKSADFKKYLVTEQIASGPGEGKTYAEYLKFYSTANPDQSTKNMIIQNQQTNFKIDTSKEYATVFLYAKGSNSIKNMLERFTSTGSAPVAGAELGAAAGAGIAALGGLAIGILGAPVVIPGGIVMITAVVIGGGTGGYLGWITANNVEYIASPIIIEYTPADLKRIGCTIAPTEQDRQKSWLG